MAREVRIAILGDSRDFSRAVANADRDASKLHGSFSRVGAGISNLAKGAAIGVAGIAVGAAVLGKGFVDAAIESQKVSKQTEAVIKSMGGAANVTAAQVSDLSEKLAAQTGVDDELIQSGQNVLLTFANVKNSVGKGPKIFDRATKAALNMSVALGTDMTSASMMVGKALNDPVKGLAKLARSGVQFSREQEDQIKTMVLYGKTGEAQAVMLAELERQFGGSAEAQATAGDKLKVVWGNLQEEMGEKLLPIVEKVASFLSENLPSAMDTVGRFISPLIEQIGAFWSTLTTGFTEDEGTPIERVALFLRDTAGPAIKGFVEDGLAALSNWWSNNGDNIIGFFTGLATELGKIATPIAAWIWETALPKLKEGGEWLINNDAAMTGVLGGIAAGFGAWAINAGAAAVATWAALAPLTPFIVVGALAAGIYYLLADRGDGWLDVLIRTGLAVMVTGGGIVNFFQMIWRWAQNAYDFVERLFNKIQDIIDLSDKIPFVGGDGNTGFDLGDALEGAVRGVAPWSGLFGFDDGGVIPGPRGAPQLVMAHGGETVLPTHKSGAAGAGVSINGNIIVNYPAPESTSDTLLRVTRKAAALAGG